MRDTQRILKALRKMHKMDATGWTQNGKRIPSPNEISSDERSVRVDLAVEAHEIASENTDGIPGIHMDQSQEENFKVSRMVVEDEKGARIIGKLPGRYVTIEVPELRKKDPELQEQISLLFAEEMKPFMTVPDDARVLIIGLGNWNVTPDALGPMVAESVFVTRHLFSLMPDLLDDGFRSVSAISPGVLGITGIETSEIVLGIVDHIKPDLVIAIDALAARSLDRVNTTIQIADSGIQPGAGVGNPRKALNRETLGVEVVAIGIPTVLDAATIASDAMELVLSHLDQRVPGTKQGDVIGRMTPEEKRAMVAEVLHPLGHNLMVTPKEIDEFVEDIAHVVALGLNLAIHKGLSIEDAKALTH